MKSATDLHWNKRALSERDPAKVNIADTVQRDLELDFVFANLEPSQRLLEVGCGNGYVTRQLRERVAHVDAFDYAENAVRRAREAYGETNNRFFHDNILAPQKVRSPYDAVVCVRVLINLRDLPEQRRAIENLAGLLQPGGRLILIEGFRDGFEALDGVRAGGGLPPLEPAKINFYSHLSDLMPTIAQLFEVEHTFHTGLFDLLTRAVYPALVGPDRAAGPSEFHEKIMPIVRAYNPPALEALARVRGFALRRGG